MYYEGKWLTTKDEQWAYVPLGQNLQKAAFWFKKAADQGHQVAQANVSARLLSDFFRGHSPFDQPYYLSPFFRISVCCQKMANNQPTNQPTLTEFSWESCTKRAST